MYEIIDNNSVIHSGDEDEMTLAFDTMVNPSDHTKKEQELYCCDWIGDLKLIHIIAIQR